MGQRADEIRQEVSDAPAEVVETRIEIEQTRADMSETIDAIQERLSPQNLKEEARDRVREVASEATDRARDAAMEKAQGAKTTVMQTIKQNPVPVALTGIGLGWLAMSSRQQSSGGSSAGRAVSQAQDKAQQQASQLGHQAQDQARRAKGEFQRMLQQNPLAVGALAVGLGVAVGLVIPETGKEDQVMGEARDSLAEKAQEKAQDTKGRIQPVAEHAQGTVKEEANKQGLTG